jgi:hypothetical protein
MLKRARVILVYLGRAGGRPRSITNLAVPTP